VSVYVGVGFVMCVSFGNMCIYLLCVVLFVLFFVLFRLCTYFLACFICAATE
jgi:hypothetical protein